MFLNLNKILTGIFESVTPQALITPSKPGSAKRERVESEPGPESESVDSLIKESASVNSADFYLRYEFFINILNGYENELKRLLPNINQAEKYFFQNNLVIRYDRTTIFTMQFLPSSRNARIYAPNLVYSEAHAKAAIAHELGHSFIEAGILKQGIIREKIGEFIDLLNVPPKFCLLINPIRNELIPDFFIYILASDQDRMDYARLIVERPLIDDAPFTEGELIYALGVRAKFLEANLFSREEATALLQQYDKGYIENYS